MSREETIRQTAVKWCDAFGIRGADNRAYVFNLLFEISDAGYRAGIQDAANRVFDLLNADHPVMGSRLYVEIGKIGQTSQPAPEGKI